MLDYARTDSHYLINLYYVLAKKLNEKNGLVAMAIECNELTYKKLKLDNTRKLELIINLL